jgi:hypothetical protein
MKKHSLTPPQMAEYVVSQPKMVDAFAANAGEFIEGIKEFWAHHGPVIEVHLQELQALKSVFGGDIFPSYAGNIATSVDLYVDTVILPDPLLRTADFYGRMPPVSCCF